MHGVVDMHEFHEINTLVVDHCCRLYNYILLYHVHELMIEFDCNWSQKSTQNSSRIC